MTIGIFAIALIVLAITIAINVGTAVASFATRRQFPSTAAPLPTASVIVPRHHFAGELGLLSAPVIVAATFALILLQAGSPVRQSQVLLGPVPAPVAGDSIGESQTIQTTANVAGASRPAWIDQSPTGDSLSERIVLGSQQYSTREEAEQELMTEACGLLQQDLAKLYPGESSVSRWKPTLEMIRENAVKRQFVEVVDRDFGTFVHPMYRVWWQLELSPEVRVEFLPLWRQGITSDRIRLVGVVVSSLVLVISLLAFYHRGRLLTNRLIRLRCLTGLAIVAWLGAIMACRHY